MKTDLGMFGLIRSDVRAKAEWLYGRASAGTVLKAFCTDGTFAMLAYRFMQSAQRLHLLPVAMLWNKINAICSQCIIGRRAEFGPEFVLVHSQGVVINTEVRGGRHVVIEHQVTIGAEKGRAPLLGDEVFIGAGAKVLGGIRVGQRARIGANAVVVDDVPDGATAVGIPARMVAEKAET